ncbi:hypothetical protein E1284_08020 [Actinomadura bangladeshensis]|uniref:Uncharacterized protein n=1 Tax=Actinomadura bangladeshensis TaxID=453573 RepID=A0A4R4P9Y0_9ACTN|nr:hypothetical protein E1284_08020 [Actinomadura bangladeshensis]
MRVAVHHLGLVDGRQRGGDPDSEAVQIVRGEQARCPLAGAGDGGLQALPVDVLADDVRLRRFQAYLDDPGGAERGDPLRRTCRIPERAVYDYLRDAYERNQTT